ncbi:DUF2461 domain-containing protein [Oricola sp.]|uniref:DUF2461 domain-containing protein n=1 Tax=Oricola sp. TaxID=1979950 RepID=UPI003BAB3596
MSPVEDAPFTDGTLQFLFDLKANNTRDWFKENKKAYEAAVKHPSRAFAELMAGEIERLTGAPHAAKLFRINRDIRFTKDKTPYNTHIHISWMPEADGASGPAWMFGLSTEYCTLGCGAFEFAKPMLESYRNTIAGPSGHQLGEMMETLATSGCRFTEPALKRIPPGFPKGHSYPDLARHKGLAVWRDLVSPQSATQADITARCIDHYGEMLPFWRFLRDLGR